jgi:hypothetical protein
MASDDLEVEKEITKEATGSVAKKPILCLDFDGVIHDYKEGWKDGTIYGDVTPGFWTWALEAANYFELHVYSSRSVLDMMSMYSWMRNKFADYVTHHNGVVQAPSWEAFGFIFDKAKPPAFLTIDDRAITFQGDWSQLSPTNLRGFKPWNQK